MVLSATLGLVSALAQATKDMPMKGSMPMKDEGIQRGMDMSKMKEMCGRMGEMHRGWAACQE